MRALFFCHLKYFRAALRCIVRDPCGQPFFNQLQVINGLAPRSTSGARERGANLRAYLEGLRGFTGDTPDANAADPDTCETLNWRRLAEILLAARVYE